MKVFDYWSIKYGSQPFSLYLHNRIGLSKGVTLFVGVIIQGLEQSDYLEEFTCTASFVEEHYGVTNYEYRSAINWLKKSAFCDVSVIWYQGYKMTSIKINIAEFCIWLQADKAFTYKCPLKSFQNEQGTLHTF